MVFAFSVITPVVVLIHVSVSLILIVLILLHSGRGGGLSDMLGGGAGAASMGSTVMERNLDRITVGVAVTWTFSTIVLGLRL